MASIPVRKALSSAQHHEAADESVYRMVVWLWFLYLLAPIKLVTFHVPALRPLSWVPELLLWACAIKWLRLKSDKRGYPAYSAFFYLTVVGILVAFLLGNWGISRTIVRQLYQFYLLGLITLTVCITPERARQILRIYFVYFLWFGIWGLVSLKLSPLGQDVDPAARIIVYWHVNFDNRDAFGPLMVAGLVYSFYYAQATKSVRTKQETYLLALTIPLNIIGFLTSFGRGAFLGFVTAAFSMWCRSRKKAVSIVAIIAAAISFSIVAPQFAERYWNSMQSIFEEGTQKGTGADRKVLWTFAWREFLTSPVFGVGTANYGIAVMRVVSPEESIRHGYGASGLYGRNVHSTPMTLLSEFGVIGVIMWSVLVIDFFRTNRRIRRAANSQPTDDRSAPSTSVFPPGYVHAVALGLNVVFLSFCVSGIFYEIIYTPLYWNVLMLNRMLYYASGAHLLTSDKKRATTHGLATPARA